MNPENTPGLLGSYMPKIEKDSLTNVMDKELAELLTIIDKKLDQTGEIIPFQLPRDAQMFIRDHLISTISEVQARVVSTIDGHLSITTGDVYDEYQHNPEVDGPVIKSLISRYDFDSNQYQKSSESLNKFHTSLWRINLVVGENQPDLSDIRGVWLMKNDTGKVEGFVVEGNPEGQIIKNPTEQIRRGSESEPDFVVEKIIEAPPYRTRFITETELSELIGELNRASIA